MKPTELLGRAIAPGGRDLRLMRRGTEYIILIDDRPLMSSRMHGSEEALAAFACDHLLDRRNVHVLVGGLGMGFTLRAALDRLPADARVTVAELIPAVVEWNRGPLGPLAGEPLEDPRVSVAIVDVGAELRAGADRFDAILLDVDNGPSAITADTNDALYDNAGVSAAFDALKPGGVLGVWSAYDDRKFEQRLRYHGFRPRAERVRARLKQGGPRHTIVVGVKP